MEFSFFLADVRPSSSSKKLSLGAAQTSSGYEEAGVHHMEDFLCMPSHWTGETDSPEVELSKWDRSNAPTPYCFYGYFFQCICGPASKRGNPSSE